MSIAERTCQKAQILEGKNRASDKKLNRESRSGFKEVALFRRRYRMAQGTGHRSIQKESSDRKRMQPLSQEVQDNSISKISEVLSPELQNEGKTKTVERITRGRRAVTYDLEVEDTHCLLADGVIAHNCMDAVRYGMDDLKPVTIEFEDFNMYETDLN